MKLTNLFFFYFLLALPLCGLIALSRTHEIDSTFFVAGLLVWGLIYHPLICGLRLLEAGKIKKTDFMLNFIPCWNFKYFHFLFFNKG
jgi:hypothetical protein